MSEVGSCAEQIKGGVLKIRHCHCFQVVTSLREMGKDLKESTVTSPPPFHLLTDRGHQKLGAKPEIEFRYITICLSPKCKLVIKFQIC